MIALLRNPAGAATGPLGVVPTVDSLECVCADLSALCERLATFEEIIRTRPEELVELDTIVQRFTMIVASMPDETR